MKRYETTVAVPSRWQADSSHVEDCIGCGKCVASCFMDAISFETGVPQVKGSICAGCGLCAANCPQGVLKMIRRAGAPEGFGRDKPERIYV
jgi:ferredoxin